MCNAKSKCGFAHRIRLRDSFGRVNCYVMLRPHSVHTKSARGAAAQPSFGLNFVWLHNFLIGGPTAVL